MSLMFMGQLFLLGIVVTLFFNMKRIGIMEDFFKFIFPFLFVLILIIIWAIS
ncbi:unnamed protein product [Fructobacillus cardui]|nr:unnamed protein product [Fructobacillus cardui]